MKLRQLIVVLTQVAAICVGTNAQQIPRTPTQVVPTDQKQTNSSAAIGTFEPSNEGTAKSSVNPKEETASDSSPRSGVVMNNLKRSNPFESKEASAVPAQQAVDPDKWQFQLTPYIWIAGITGTVGLGPLVTDVNAGLGDDNVNLNFGFMSTFEARKNRFVILTDLQYSNLGTENATPGPLFSTATADFKTFVLAPEVGYRVFESSDKSGFVDVLGGVRYWHIRSDLTFNTGLLNAVSASRSRGWVDAIGGIRAKGHLSKRVFLTGDADLGGGGSEFTYQLFGGMGILVGKRYALIAGYRALSVDYNRDGFLFDTVLHGPVVGFGIKF